MIVSTLYGRIRIRSKFLKSARACSTAKRCIEEYPGVIEVRANRGAGSLVVRFDEQAVDVGELEERIESICMSASNGQQNGTLSRRINRVTKVGMISTLAASVACGFAGKKKPHIGFGVAFLGFAGAHIYRHSSRLLR